MATSESSIAITAASSRRPGPAVLGAEIGDGEPPDGGERRGEAFHGLISYRSGVEPCDGLVAAAAAACGDAAPDGNVERKIGRIAALAGAPRACANVAKPVKTMPMTGWNKTHAAGGYQ